MTASRLQKKFRLPKFFLAQIDPFNSEVTNVRVPDESTAPSSAFNIFDENNMTVSTATGYASAVFFTPGLNVMTSGTGTGSASWSWSASYGGTTATSKITAIQAQYSLLRPVSHGIKLSCPLAPTSTAGFVHMCLYTLDTYAASSWTLPTTLSQMTECPFYRRITLASLTQNPIVISNKFLDQTAFRYVDTSSNENTSTSSNTFHVPFSWMGVLVCIEGHGLTTNSTICNVQSICHFEGQSKYGGLNTDGTAEPGNNTVMENTANISSQTSPSFVEGGVEAAQRMAAAAGEFVNRVAGNVAGNAAYGFAAGASGQSYGPPNVIPGISGVNNDPNRIASKPIAAKRHRGKSKYQKIEYHY